MNQENYDYLKNRLGLQEITIWYGDLRFFIVRGENGKIEEIIGTDMKNYGLEVLMLSPACVARNPGEIEYYGEVINTLEWRKKHDNSRVDQRTTEGRS
jgi:hypothetical protein